MAGVVRSLITRILFKSDETGLKKVETHTRQAKREMRAASRAAFVLKRNLRQVAFGWRSLVAAAAAGQIAKVFTTNFAKAADEAAKFSKAIGVSIQAYQGLTHAAQLNGATQENINKALPQLAKRSAEAADGQKKQAIAFARLGVRVKDASGKLKSADKLFLEVADGLVGLRDKSRRTQIAMDLFGRTGATLMPTFLQGAKGIKAAMIEAKKLGIVLSKEQAQIAEKFNDEMLRSKSVLKGVRNQIAVKLLPAITKNLRAFQEWAREGDNLKRALKALLLIGKALAVVFALVAAAKFGQTLAVIAVAAKKAAFWLKVMWRQAALALAKFILIAAAVAAVVLVIQSLIVWMRGGRSAVGDFLERLGIADQAKTAILALGKAWRAFIAFLPVAGRFIAKLGVALLGVMKKVWTAMVPGLKSAGAALLNFLRAIWPIMMSIVIALRDAYVGALKAMVKAWDSDLKPAFMELKESLLSLWVAVRPAVFALLKGLGAIAIIVIKLAAKWIPLVAAATATMLKALGKWASWVINITSKVLGFITKIISGIKDAVNWMLRLLGLRGETDLGMTLAKRGIAPTGGPQAQQVTGTQNNKLSVGTVAVTVQGTANMTPAEMQAAVDAGVKKGFQQEINKAFSSMRALVPG